MAHLVLNKESSDSVELCFFKGVDIDSLEDLERSIKELDIKPFYEVKVNLENIERLDTSGSLIVIRTLMELGVKKSKISVKTKNDSYRQIFNLVKNKELGLVESKAHPRLSLFENIGKATFSFIHNLVDVLTFLGKSVCALSRVISRPRDFRIKEFISQLESSFVNAILIVSMLTFLVGVVVAYLFASQAQRYGANVFVVDALVLAMCRELSPIIVSIVVAGRSGSSYTAQIGTMKLNEEIDALVSLGLSPMQVLVVPRLVALMLALPLLTFIGDISGMLGGLLISDMELGLTAWTFIERMQKILTIPHVVTGLFKALVFSIFISIIGCRMGLVVKNDAKSVGLNTTSTVVQSIVSVILLNATFAILFVKLGI